MKSIITFLVTLLTLSGSSPAQTIFFREKFEDADLFSRGWYDNNAFPITAAEHIPGSTHCAEFHFLVGSRTPLPGGAFRHLFPESDEVYLSYWVKYSTNWTGSNKPYHPHDFHFVTNQNDKYVGPAYTHLTTYIEENGGTPLLSIQDGENVDENNIGNDLTLISENRSLAGCNGNSDGTGAEDCYLNGTQHWNGKTWRSGMKYFADTTGKYYKNDWHFIEALFKMNDIVSGKAVANGSVMMWYDGELIVNEPKVMLRTGAFPSMKFNQFLIAPYIGDGSPIDQTMWVDDLTVASARITSSSVKNENPASRLLLYPNPFSDRLTFEYSSTTEAVLQLCDELGRVVSRAALSSGSKLTFENLQNHRTLFYRLTSAEEIITGIAVQGK